MHPAETLPRLPFILLLLLACILPSLSDAKNYYRYTNCAPTNYTCGTMKFTVGYPFQFGTARPDYCRYPGYYLTCTDDTLLINIDEKMMPFQVKNIDYGNHLLTLVDLNFSAETCPLPNYNVTINTTIFDYNDRNTMMTIYNCSTLQTPLPAADIYKIPCAEEISGQYYYYRLNDKDSVFGNCILLSQVLVQISAANQLLGESLSFGEALNEGFMLRWTAGKGWCSDCVSSGGNCGYNTVARDQQTCYCPNGTAIRNCTTVTQSKNKHTGVIIGSSVGAAAGLVGLCGLCVFLYIRTRRRRHSPSSSNLIRNASSSVPNSYSKSKDPELGGGSSVFYQTHLFSYDELEAATDGFSDSRELGDGGFGTVYKGILRDGRVVAIKRLYENNWRRVEQFKNEVAILSLIRHPNLVALYGCTSRHSRELLLVYEYISNGTIADHLHGSRADERALTWPRRLSIAIETADALAYLHAVNPPIIHRDVKTNNILLDADFHVKVADFGLSRLFPLDATHVSTAPQGTPGYVDPEYHKCFQLTDKSDVYSFGVVLVELISSMPAVDITRRRDEINLANMAIRKIQNCQLEELVDAALGYEEDLATKRMITMVAELAFRCLQPDGEMRPPIREVVEVLRGIQREGYNKNSEGEEGDIVVKEDSGLLKNIPPFSPDSVAAKWPSRTTTPNTSE
ncbi:LEAF RUST 10 DISEASE-RESISTANCE LOCUS RECEPTOR-LIKE PROTEIN KINASE-like 1.2 isoform X2 [Ananas comosus]|uniref:non-specific serine/threonine protein kinase n=1 Tax=Ananas comosus TaxID=4615 RepID=A0A6P5GLF0_ANACO|nr:LEAF RUST 10 DISEASE-RESISTANCE LOCUS RECEPTOR-LIKE PROTEIN KINASE-like 1.2 isoform X2 [Ananas comosus]